MLKLYTNTEFLTETHRRHVFPLLFDLVFKKNKKLLDTYTIVDSAKTSDIVVFPIDYGAFLKHNDAFLTLLQSAKKTNKPIWIYSAGDYGFTNYIANSYTFRLGGFNSKLDDNTYVIPSFVNDPYKSFLSQNFSALAKGSKPKIGFVGHAQSGLVKYLKEYTNYLKYLTKRSVGKLLADRQSFYPSSIKRAKFLKVLALHEDLDTTFVLRNKYRAGSHSKLSQQESSKAFYDNIYNSAYTFCIRGVGNFSVRFYETLAVGRIPILLNTDCRLPLGEIIDWSKHCLIINLESKTKIADQILEFHNNLTASEFENLQIANRNLWLSTLNREAYFFNIAKQFKTKLK